MYGGWDWEAESRVYDGEEADFGSGSRESEYKREIGDEAIRRTREVTRDRVKNVTKLECKYDDFHRNPEEYEIRHISPDTKMSVAKRKLYDRIFECAVGEMQRKQLAEVLIDNYGFHKQPTYARLSEFSDELSTPCTDFSASGVLFFRKKGLREWTVRVN